jgi:predicted Zn-dependent protease with MMP-like domain
LSLTQKLDKRGHFSKSSQVSLDQFEALVNQALEEIPEEFLEKLEDVDIFVEEAPAPELLKEMGMNKEDLLFGLYQGLPRPGKSFFQGQALPDRITLFRLPIISICRTKHEIKEQIKKTLIHEIAHHFGLTEARIRHLGY